MVKFTGFKNRLHDSFALKLNEPQAREKQTSM